MRKRRTFVRRFLCCIFHQHILVPVVGLEPTRCRHRRILNPLRLPFHHTGTFYRETPKILIGENKERTHYKSHILL